MAIATHIDYVIGMSKPISDKAAIAFAKGFYTGLGAGKIDQESDLYEDAFQDGCNQIEFDNCPEQDIPTLYKNGQLIQSQAFSNSHATSNDSTAVRLSIELEFIDETPSASAPTSRGGQPPADLRSELVALLKETGRYEVQNTRSDFLTIVGQLAQNITDHQALLVVLFETAKTAIEGLLKLQTKHEAEGKTIKISLEVDGQSISIEAPDLESTEKLLDKFQTTHPATTKQITTKSKLKVKGQAKKEK